MSGEGSTPQQVEATRTEGANPGLLSMAVTRATRAVVNVIDPDAILETIDVDSLLERIDVNALLDRIDVDALVDRIDVQGLLDRADIDEIIRHSSEEIAASVMHGLFAFDLVKSRLHALGNDVASDASDVAEEYEAFQRWYHREHPDLHLRWLTWREGNKKNYKK